MSVQVLEKLIDAVNSGESVALVTLTEVSGSTPADIGNVMAVFEDGSIAGTIGGGKLEYEVTKEALQAIKEEKNVNFSHSLKSGGDLGMKCGGHANGNIRIFTSEKKLLVIGGGHIGENIVYLAKFLKFKVTVIDDRPDFKNKESLQIADEIIISNYNDFIDKVKIDSNTYAVIATKGHLGDLDALLSLLEKKLKYIGVIGSKTKTAYVRSELMKKGYSEEDLANTYAPIGLSISDQTPKEIAISILAEILAVKNKKVVQHMDKTKNI